MFFKIDIFKNFSNFTGKHLCLSLFLIKLQALKSLFNNTCKAWSPATLLKTDCKTGVFLFSLQHFLEHFICSYFCLIASYLTGFFLSGKLCLESIFFFFCLYQIFSGAVLASQVRFFTRKFQPFRIRSLFSFLNHNLLLVFQLKF